MYLYLLIHGHNIFVKHKKNFSLHNIFISFKIFFYIVNILLLNLICSNELYNLLWACKFF